MEWFKCEIYGSLSERGGIAEESQAQEYNWVPWFLLRRKITLSNPQLRWRGWSF